MASITIYLQCCCLPTTHKTTTTEQNKTNTHTHTRDPRRNLTSHDRSQRENKGQLFQLIRTFVKKVGVWKENASEVISLMQLILFKASEVQFTVTAQQIQNVLNENLSQSGSGLAKIGTEWGSGEGHFDKTSLTASSSHRSPSPFQRLIHPKDLGGVICLVWVYIMTWGCNMSAIMASDSPEDFSDYLNSDSVRVSSQVLIMCHDNKNIPNVCENNHNIKFHVPSNKTQVMHTTTQTWEIPQSSQSRTTSTFLHDVSLRSASNSEFWMPSRTLLSLSSLRDIWQQNKPQTTKICIQNYIYCVSRRLSPPFKLKLDACAQPCRHFWKQQVNLELTKSTILLSLDQANSSAFGTLLRDRYQGYILRYSRVPWICIYPRGENAAVPVRGSWRGVGETDLIRPVTSSITWVGGDFMSFTSKARG